MDSDASELFSDCGSDDRDSSTSEPCSSDDLSFTPAAAAGIHRLLLSCAAEASDGPISSLVAELESPKASSGMVDKAAYLLHSLVGSAEGRSATVKEGGISVLVEMVEVGTSRQKEIAILSLLQICDDNAVYRTMVAREGAIPPLVALSQPNASPKLKTKVH
ncbi:U-box domain-containing protein 4 [Triticum urartu]|uniref:U-box domain-containing protein 4 n=1 Tax=Triticum urartu TaxID=4572 RepID=M8A036_TRIUA|nr:U-box domain-containing protein 4 [Triticum urartu]